MNNKLLLHILATLLCILSLTACNRADEWEATGGDTGLLVTLTDGTHGVETRATPQELREQLGDEFLDQFRLTITHVTGDHKVYPDYPYDGELIPLPAGFYDVEAKFGDNPTLALDAPYYTGRTEDVEVKGHQQKSVSIACSVANALLSVKYENVDKLDEKFTNYYVSVHVGKDSVNIKDTAKSAYFRADTTSLQLFFHYDDGKSQQIKSDAIPTTFEAGDHLILTLRMSPTMTMEVSKAEEQSVTVEETIPQEWLPKPKIEAEGFTNNQLSFAETEKKTAVLNLNTALPLQDLKLSFQFEDEQFSSLNGKEYLLSNPIDRATVQQTLGIDLPDVGDTDAKVDLSPLIVKMQTKAGETVTNTLTLDVLANGRWSSEDKEANRTYTMVCNKPEFSVSVYPGNIWTKEFTVNPLMEEEVTSGDFTALSQDMIYQYRTAEATNWTTITDNRRQGNLLPNTTYYVRGLFRGVIPSKEVEVKTYPMLEIENGNLSEYSIVRGEDGNRWNGHGAQFEWTSWSTINETTTPNCPITAYSYNTRSGTRPATDVRPNANDDTAVWIITIGYGYGGTNNSPKSVTPSELVYNKQWETPTHPTGVHFWYKYAPYNGDKSDISVYIYSGDQIIGEGILQEENTVSAYSLEGYTLTINYNMDYVQLVPDKIALTFRSGFNESVESRESGGLTSSNTANPKFRGSELYIDDISLIYDK